MGGTTFEDFCGTDRAKSAQEAYDLLCREADHEYGHSYTGAINVTGGFRMHATQVMTRADAQATWERLLDSDNNPYNDKWSSCMCIAVGEGKTKSRTITRTLSIPGVGGSL